MANTTKSNVRKGSAPSPSGNAGIEDDVEESVDEESDTDERRMGAADEGEDDGAEPSEGQGLNAAPSGGAQRQTRQGQGQRGRGR